ncbi:hypothetical protein BJ912DRAFT_908905 [Pholiota molesta]|nr:hypothetical protein BJ912DRAFT_908905 [Pholiota molesta]
MLQDASESAPTPPSDAQPQIHYPSRPSPENPPRHSVIGGYVIDNATCVAWGSRILMTPLNPEIPNDSLAAFTVIMRKVENKPHRGFFTMVGSESYIVVTQSAPFRGWKGMDPELIPKFEEGEREAYVRELLKAEGVTQYEFRTELY